MGVKNKILLDVIQETPEMQLATFDRASKLFRAGQYGEAREAFGMAAAGSVRAVSHNARLHMSMCERRMEPSEICLNSAQDFYNVGVERLNIQDMEGARRHLTRAVELTRASGDSADHIYYALANCCAMDGDSGGAYENLKRAIEIDPKNRTAARNDSDFFGFYRSDSPCVSFIPGKTCFVLRTSSSPMDDPLRIVAMGGGTGLSALLQGLKHYATEVDITAIVTVTDDGGSSGRLRRDFDVLPPGDIRNCMVALSEDEALLSKLFQYRFTSGRGLKGHSFGNLFLTALTHITGEFSEAVRLSSRTLAIMGNIYPSTRANVQLEATLVDGSSVRGETRISRSRRRIDRISLVPRRCLPLPETLLAIEQADLITIGPGSLFTSVIPNLLVSGIPKAIKNSLAVKAYFVNLMWQPGETIDFRASDHVLAVEKHARGRLVDFAIVNSRSIRPAMRRRYAEENVQPVENDLEAIQQMGIEVVTAELLCKGSRVRHDPTAAAAVAMDLARRGRLKRNNAN